ncbi:MAG: glycoside hydrolase family 5 protein [Lactobacillales bacterium]|jgi:endoglucanase|nr:glycoside hydrolase family 5 protein [Lactobacillales bacterium]
MKKYLVLVPVLLFVLIGGFIIGFTTNNSKSLTDFVKGEENSETLALQVTKEAQQRIYEDLGAGWNLGNALDVLPKERLGAKSETYWGNPKVTKELFAAVKKAGFKSVRIPVTWETHEGNNYWIEDDWKKRVTQVVDDALDEDLRVIIDVHHDSFFTPTKANYAYASKTIINLWTQIGHMFEKYDDRVIFEGMNEPRLPISESATDEETWLAWMQGTTESRETVDKLNLDFLTTVRNLGGKNTTRLLLLATYMDSSEETVIKTLPPTIYRNVAISIHMYGNEVFDMNGETTYRKMNDDSEKQLKDYINSIQALNEKGYPAILTEFGSSHVNDKEQFNYLKEIIQTSKENDIPYFWWDNGVIEKGEEGGFALFDRETEKVVQPKMVRALTK